jgi:hypothetical protein
LEEPQRRNYSAITTRNYLRVVADFAKYFGKSPDKLGPNELRTYQAYLLQDRKLKVFKTPSAVERQSYAGCCRLQGRRRANLLGVKSCR